MYMTLTCVCVMMTGAIFNETTSYLYTLTFLITVHVRVFISNKNAPLYAASFSFLKIQIISIIIEVMMTVRLCALPLVIYTHLECYTKL